MTAPASGLTDQIDHLVIVLAGAEAGVRADRAQAGSLRWAEQGVASRWELAALVYSGRTLVVDGDATPLADAPTLPRHLDRLGIGWRLYAEATPMLSRLDGDFRRPNQFDRFVPLAQLATDVAAGRLARVSFVEADDERVEAIERVLRDHGGRTGALPVLVAVTLRTNGGATVIAAGHGAPDAAITVQALWSLALDLRP